MGFVEIEGLRIHYAAPGDPSERRGQRVLYVHGTGCNTRVWDEHLAAIADAHTPVAIDLPGHGESAGRGCRGVADYAHHVLELANALGWDRFVVAGHSMGGGIALDIALRHGDRLAGLMCIDTGARLRVHPDILRGAAQAAAQGRGVATDRAWGFARSTPQTVVDAVTALTAATDPRVTHADWIADDTFDVMSRVGEIRVPTLALCGEEDRLTPVRYHRFLQDRIPGCRLVIVRRAGHWVFREQLAEFTRAVRGFLDSL